MKTVSSVKEMMMNKLIFFSRLKFSHKRMYEFLYVALTSSVSVHSIDIQDGKSKLVSCCRDSGAMGLDTIPWQDPRGACR